PPERRPGVEILDDPAVDPSDRARSMADVARSNVWFGGRRAATLAWRELLDALSLSRVTLLDVGTGLGDLPRALRREAGRRGVTLVALGFDCVPGLLANARPGMDHPVCADARHLPFEDGAVDVVLCSQVLHHFADDDAGALVAELHRVARRGVIVADL